MFKLNLKISLRNLWKYKFTNSIKLFGLVIGLSTVVLLVSYVLYQLSFDRSNPNADLVYRLHMFDRTTNLESSQVPSGLGEVLKEQIPEVDEISKLYAAQAEVLVEGNLYPIKTLAAAPSFFKMFGQKLIKSQTDDLTQPGTIVISQKLSDLIFPGISPLGKSIQIKGRPQPSQIVGLMEDIPSATHFKADIVAIRNIVPEPLNFSGYSAVNQYVLFKKGTDITAVEAKLKSVLKKYNLTSDTEVKLMPVTKIHLYSHTESELEANGDIKYIYIFSTAALFILFIALINFINLTVAASVKRSKEIGVKKVLGASINQLRGQFLSESYIYFLVAAFFSMIISYDLMPMFSAKLGIDLVFANIFNLKTVGASLTVILIAGFIAGFYPAMILSKLMPVKVLKGDSSAQKIGSVGLKKGLMIVQFSVSALLIVCTLIIYAQLEYMSNKNLGFDKEQVLFSAQNTFGDKYQSFKTELLHQKGIADVSLSTLDLGDRFGGMSQWTDEKDTTKTIQCDFIYSDLDFIKTLDIKLLAGRQFSEKYPSDYADPSLFMNNTMTPEERERIALNTSLILNQSAIKTFDITDPIGKTVNLAGLKGKIVGIVADFNGMSLRDKVTPVVLKLDSKKTSGNTYIKVDGRDIHEVKVTIDKIWRKYFAEPAPLFELMNEHLQKLYVSEMRLGKLFLSFASIAIILCCIGLFGVVYFEMEQRTKEIAVRKILGASVKDLLKLLNSSFLKVVVFANFIVWPVAYLLAKNWLADFYYRIDITYLPFLYALGTCFLLTLVTVSIQALKTIKKSPVKALKYE